MFNCVKNLFKKEDKDENLEFLNKTTGRKWEKHVKGYVCWSANYYVEIDELGYMAKCTRQAKTIGLQTTNGPFCEWFNIEKSKIYIYLKQ